MKQNKKKKHILIIAFAVIAILIVISQNNKEKGITVDGGYPQRSTITESIPANGKIRPVSEIKISPDVSGEIIELNVKEGDKVEAGDLLIKIKQDLYLSAVERAEASLNSVKAQYLQQKAQFSQAELAYNRNKVLHEQRAISEADYENSLSQYEIASEQLNAAQFNVKSAEAALKEARENLNKTSIYSPSSGIVSKLDVEKGERVVGTTQMAGTEMLRIANFEEMELLVEVNENDIIKLNIADTAHIEVDAYPNRKFTGIVTQIANSAKNADLSTASDQVTNFEVHVKILPESYVDLYKNSPIPFRPGMSASANIITERCYNVLTVPLQAITTRPDLTEDSGTEGVTEYLFTYDKNSSTAKATVVKTGIQDMRNIVVTEGISDSTMIITGPYSAITRELQNGTKVIIKELNKNK